MHKKKGGGGKGNRDIYIYIMAFDPERSPPPSRVIEAQCTPPLVPKSRLVQSLGRSAK